MPQLIAEQVFTTLASVKRIPREKITLDSSLAELGMDSLDAITMLFELENAFKISIPDEQARSIRSVRDIVEGIEKLLVAPIDSATATH
jgi:acyl carrier protein